MRDLRKESMPVRPSGSFGMNHAAHSGITRGEVEILVGGFFFRASLSSLGVTRYEEKEIWRVPGRWDDIAGRNKRDERMAAKAMILRRVRKVLFLYI